MGEAKSFNQGGKAKMQSGLCPEMNDHLADMEPVSPFYLLSIVLINPETSSSDRLFVTDMDGSSEILIS